MVREITIYCIYLIIKIHTAFENWNNAKKNMLVKKKYTLDSPAKFKTAKMGALVATAPSTKCGYFTLSHADREPEWI